MSILVDRTTRVLCQGLRAGPASPHEALPGIWHANRRRRDSGPRRPNYRGRARLRHGGRGGGKDRGRCDDDLRPAPLRRRCDSRSGRCGIRLVVAITEGIPILDMVRAMASIRRSASVLIGPNCPGIITPDECKIGIMPGYIHRRGPHRCDQSLGHAHLRGRLAVDQRRLRASTCIGLGGDPIVGTSFVDLLRRFEGDPATEGVLMIGEIGGSAEEEAAAFIARHVTKRWRLSSPAARRRPASGWATPARSSPAAKGLRPKKSPPRVGRHPCGPKPGRNGAHHAAGNEPKNYREGPMTQLLVVDDDEDFAGAVRMVLQSRVLTWRWNMIPPRPCSASSRSSPTR